MHSLTPTNIDSKNWAKNPRRGSRIKEIFLRIGTSRSKGTGAYPSDVGNLFCVPCGPQVSIKTIDGPCKAGRAGSKQKEQRPRRGHGRPKSFVSGILILRDSAPDFVVVVPRGHAVRRAASRPVGWIFMIPCCSTLMPKETRLPDRGCIPRTGESSGSTSSASVTVPLLPLG